MPTRKCTRCGGLKPEKQFALLKTMMGVLPKLDTVCTDCRQGTTKCIKCGRVLWYVNKRHGGLVFCGWCVRRHDRLVLMNKKIVIRGKINRLIKIIDKMENHSIKELRGHLFKTIEGLMDGTVSTETAAHVSDVAKTIIDTARVENEFIQLTKGSGTGFIPMKELENES